jgi:hypothetical protein
VQRLVDDLAETVTLAERYQAAERTFAFQGGGVEQHAPHWLLASPGVDALGDACRGVAAFQGQFADHVVRESMQQHVAHARPLTRWQAAVAAPGLVGGVQGLPTPPHVRTLALPCRRDQHAALDLL